MSSKGFCHPRYEEIICKNKAVIFTDVVNSSATFENVGDLLATEMILEFFEVSQRIIELHDGMVVKTTGDGVMAVFDCPVQALRVAMAIQREPSRSFQCKIGIAYGEVAMVETSMGWDYFGQTVILASRLLMEPGMIVMSQKLYDQPGVADLLHYHYVVPNNRAIKGFHGQIPCCDVLPLQPTGKPPTKRRSDDKIWWQRWPKSSTKPSSCLA